MDYLPKVFVSRKAPFFTGQAWTGVNFKEICLDDYKGKYLVLKFYERNFCELNESDILVYNQSLKEFRDSSTFVYLDCAIVFCSGDSKYSHREFTLRYLNGISQVKLPLLSDVKQSIARDYGVLITEGIKRGYFRNATFIIDDESVVRHMQVFSEDSQCCADSDEILRLVKAFQYSKKYSVVCQSKWLPGAKGVWILYLD